MALASLSSDPKHKLPLSIFRNISRKVQGTLKYYAQLIGRHAYGQAIYMPLFYLVLKYLRVGFLQASYASHKGDWIKAVAIPATGRVLSASSATVVVWTDEAERSINIGNQQYISFQANGSKFVTGDNDGKVKIWDVELGKKLRTLEGPSGTIWSFAFSPDGSKMAAGSWDATIRVWDTKMGQGLLGVMEGHTSLVTALAFSPDGTRLVSGSYDDTVRLWDEAGKSKVLEGHNGPVFSLSFSKDYIISELWDKTIQVWNAGSGDMVRVLRGHTNLVRCVAFSPDFKLITSGSNDCTARLWDVSSGEVLAIYDVGEPVMSIAFSFDGKLIVTGSWYGKVHVWNADVLL
ncbi:WD repeat-containing protein 38-like [Pleurotus ostreatus]|uniref:WD repeat-containing protein 38-like n=1 Tax=Pleurotus ostreatus TaxID=5322 RepID=A0A8H7A148_PLEOS|nr:WD repeat-containing protein 38-like [Pleurotus ostreatus]KAF7433843.1 WD repeat-containing protein 38-like [Pleurotus ostreatus]